MNFRIVPALLALVAAPTFAQTVGPALPGTSRARPAADADVSRNAPVNGVLVLYGNQRCPTTKEGSEVVVCVRRSAEEQFRIPKELRDFEITPENQAWAAREQSTLAEGTGVNGIGSCSVVGPGGQTGCFVQNARRAKQESKERAKAATPDLSPY